MYENALLQNGEFYDIAAKLTDNSTYLIRDYGESKAIYDVA